MGNLIKSQHFQERGKRKETNLLHRILKARCELEFSYSVNTKYIATPLKILKEFLHEKELFTDNKSNKKENH